MQTRTLTIALVLAAGLLAGCNKKNAATSGNPVEQKLQELAGTDAKNCGAVKSIQPDAAKPASDCAMQEAQAKKPFYVSYELPGLTVAVAGTSAGKLYSVQQQSPAPDQQGGPQSSTAPASVTVEPCPAELRLASSGRVTCYAAGSFGAMGGANPHGGGMTMPPGMTNPHGGGMSMPPASTPNPHGTDMPSSHGSATKNGSAPAKPASKQ